MKITAIKTFLMQAGTPSGGLWASDRTPGEPSGEPLVGSRNWLFVKVETNAGITGIGECSGWPRVIETAIRDITPLLIGEDPGRIERLWQKLHIATMGHGLLGTVGGGAMTGIDMALWDIKGKQLGTSVANLLGGRVRDRVRIYAHANTAEVALDNQKRGLTAIKCGGVSDPVRKVADIREAVGAEMDIAIDMHGPPWMTPADAVRLGRALEPYDILFLEDPIPPENIDGYERIRDAVAIPLAAGERMATIWGLRPLMERGLIDIIQPDTGRAGGITQMKKIAAMAEAHHIMLAPHSGSLGPVAEYAALHLLAAIPNTLMLERIDNDWPGRYQTILPHPIQRDGWLDVPDAPGLGCDIDEAFVAKHPCRSNAAIPISEATGSYAAGTWSEHVYVQTRLRRHHYFSAKPR